MRTYDRATFTAADEAWRNGAYGPAWSPYRRLAAERGYLFPPSGSAADDRDTESPSQRAIVWRAIEDRPDELARIVARCRSWSEVVDRIIGMEARLRAEAGERELVGAWERDRDSATHTESVMALGSILGRLDASR